MESRAALAALRRGWAVVTALGLLAAGLAFALALPGASRYQASTTLFFSFSQPGTASELNQGSSFVQSQVRSFAELANEPVVLDPVIRDLRLRGTAEALSRSVDASVQTNSVLVQINVHGLSAQGTVDLANAVGNQLSVTAEQLAPPGRDNATSIHVTTVATARVASAPGLRRVILFTLVGLLVGLALGATLAMLRGMLADRVRDRDDLAAFSERPVLGELARVRRFQALASAQADPGVAQLRTNILSSGEAGAPRTFVVTSSLRGEGATSVAAALAVSLTHSGLRVVLVDGDLTYPSVAAACGVANDTGLTDVLADTVALDDVLTRAQDTSLDVLPAGRRPANPSELLGSANFGRVLRTLEDRYDVVLLDSPPLLAATDGAVLSQQCDGALLVVEVGRTNRRQVEDSLRALALAQASTVGFVLNKVPKRLPRGPEASRAAEEQTAATHDVPPLTAGDQTLKGPPDHTSAHDAARVSG